MKKRLSLLIALVMMLAFVLPTIAACDTDKVVEKIEVVDPKTEFTLGVDNTIDYDNLNLKVTYADGSDPETKTVKQWGATYTEANLKVEGTSSYTVSYGGKTVSVTVTVKVEDKTTSENVTVTYKYLDGSTPDTQSQITKGTKAALHTPSRDNYTFDGWYTKDGTTSNDWGNKWNADDPVNADITLYAKWTKNVTTYIVTFDDGMSHTTQQSVEQGGTVTFPEVENPRHTLEGWYTKNTEGNWSEQPWTEQTPVTGNVTLYAKWADKVYCNVMFHHMEKDPETTSTLEVEQGSALTFPTISREGYTLLGWYTQNGFTSGNWGEKWAENKPAQQSQIELFAKWQKNSISVTFNFNFPGGTEGEPQAETVTLNVANGDKLSEHIPSVEGKSPAHYGFSGWFTNPTSGVVASDDLELLGDVTFYAHWSQKKVTVTFDFNGDDASTAQKQVEINEGAAVGNQWPADPTRDGYRFDGWKDAQSRTYTDRSAIDESVTITAQWVQLVTVKFDLNYDGAENNIKDVVLDINTSLGAKMPANPSRNPSQTTKYAFAGWFDNKTGGTQYDGSKTIDSDKTLYAHWTETEILYTVTYHGNEGYFADYAETTTSQVAAQQAISSHPECERDGYELEGWYTDPDCRTKYSNEPVAQDMDLYAKWEQKVSVFFHWGFRENGEDKITHQYFGKTETSITFNLDTPSYEGHKFLGWYDQESGGTRKGDSGASVTLTVDGQTAFHYYAQWKPITVKVTLDALRKGEVEIVSVEYGSELDLASHVPNVTDATFEGWFRNNGNLESVEWGEQVTKFTVTEDTTLYAKWNSKVSVILVMGNGKENIQLEIPSGASLLNYTIYNQIKTKFPDFTQILPEDAFPTWQLTYYNGDLISDFLAHQNDANWQIFNLKGQLLNNLVFKVTPESQHQEMGKYDTPEYLAHTFGANKHIDLVNMDFGFDWSHNGAGVELPWPVFGKKKTGPLDDILPESLKGIDLQLRVTNTTWLYANWTEVEGATKHKVTFHYNDGTDNKYEADLYSGSTLALPGPTRNGYTFDGWYKGDANQITQPETKWNDTDKVESELHLWAKWTQATTSFVVTLNNGTETKSFTVQSNQSLNAAAEKNAELKQFLATANTWLNGTEVFDLTTPVDKNLTLVAQVESSLSGLVLSFSAPDSYLNYSQRATTSGDSLGYFKLTGEQAAPYEVGTVNKFIFRPSVRLRTTDKGTVTDYNPTTTAKVYVSDTKGGEYKPLDSGYTIKDNTYKFDESLAGKYIRLEVSLSGSNYTIPSSIQNKVTAEFVLVKGGYNVYDQRGLSVMNDNQQKVWSSMWGVEAEIRKDDTLNRGDAYKYKVVYKDPATHQDLDEGNTTVGVKLAADDQPLYKYVGNIDWVILHNDIELDPTQMPQDFFWQAGDPLYYAAYQSLAGWQNQQDKLVGSLKDGDNSGVISADNYAIMMDTADRWNAINLGFSLNMQKGFYSTSRVSVSGNYFSLTHILERGGRKLQNYVDWQASTKVSDPVTHWSVFQMMTDKNNAKTDEDVTQRPGYPNNPFTLKNIAMKGSTPQKDYYDKGKTVYFAPAGIMLANTYSSINIQNLNANNFFTTIVGDNYGDSDDFHTNYNVANSKFYDTYSNMVYTWRGHITIDTCEMVGSGGPLFILCDDNREDPGCDNDTGGPELEVKGTCRLEAYATGAESWYDANNATALVTTMRGQVETSAFNSVYKTLRWIKDPDGTMRPYKDGDGDKNQYINLIAVMICSPGNLLSGASTEGDGKHDFTPAVKGKSTFNGTINGAQTTSVEYAMHSTVVNAVKKAAEDAQGKHDATAWPILAQMGNNYFAAGLDGVQKPLDAVFNNPQLGVGDSTKFAKATADSNGNLVCVYLSAAALLSNANAPYFGAILGIGDYNRPADLN